MRNRIDHARYHICITLANFVIALFILWHWRSPTSLIAPDNPIIGKGGMSLWVENLNGIVLLIGSLGALFGAASGTKYFRPKADLRDSYLIGGYSLILVAASVATILIGILWGYWPHVWSQFAAIILAIAVVVASIWKAIDLLRWSGRINDELRRRLGVGP